MWFYMSHTIHMSHVFIRSSWQLCSETRYGLGMFGHWMMSFDSLDRTIISHSLYRHGGNWGETWMEWILWVWSGGSFHGDAARSRVHVPNFDSIWNNSISALISSSSPGWLQQFANGWDGCSARLALRWCIAAFSIATRAA